MQPVQRGPLCGLVGQLLLLVALSATVGLGPVGWAAGLVAAAGTTTLLSRALHRRREGRLGPANTVTLGRAGLVVGVTALVGASFTDLGSTAVLVGLATVALVLDAVDGRVARHTDTASELGARFDLEVDALLILVLSGYVAASIGWWVLLIGAARYLLLAAAAVLPWLGRPSPPRYWSKVVAAVQGVVLVVAAADLLPPPVTVIALVGALALLAESFGRQVWVLWQQHRGRQPTLRGAPPLRTWSAANVVACLLVWGALTLPHRSSELSPAVLLSVPVEAVALLALLLVLPVRAARVVGVAAGALLGVMVLVKLLDLAFRVVLDRPFDPLNDWFYIGPAYGVLTDSVGADRALLAATGVAIVAIGLLLALPWAGFRLRRLVHDDRRSAGWVLVGLTAVWAVGAGLGLQVVPGVDVASSSTSSLAIAQVVHARDNLADRRRFAREIEHDPLASRAVDGSLLAGLEGKDVLVVFVESYGRVAVDGPLSEPVVETLDAGTATLRARGYGMRSAFLTSPTFGAASWLAHATLQAGVWVDSQQRYDQLLATDRLTLTRAFGEKGWRTVFQVPANTRPWPQGSAFYGYDELYDASDVGYHGPKLGYASMPDQFTLAAFDRLELAPEDRPPVMAEIDLISSHHPWTPLPSLLPWDSLGDGRLYSAAAVGPSAEETFRDPERVKDLYVESLVYSWRTLVSFLARHADDELVVVALGDHQPHSYVTGPSADRDVPVTVLSTDPAVLHSIREWRWQPGLRPEPDAPVQRMDEFRDAFLTAFSPPP